YRSRPRFASQSAQGRDDATRVEIPVSCHAPTSNSIRREPFDPVRSPGTSISNPIPHSSDKQSRRDAGSGQSGGILTGMPTQPRFAEEPPHTPGNAMLPHEAARASDTDLSQLERRLGARHRVVQPCFVRPDCRQDSTGWKAIAYDICLSGVGVALPYPLAAG